jgi:hypothetical protein
MNALAVKRPFGIYLLSQLYFVLGLIGLIGLMIFIGCWDKQMSRDVPLASVAVFLPASTLVLLAASNGMWKGATWGWYLGSFLGAYGILRNVVALLDGYSLFRAMTAQELGALSNPPWVLYLKWSLGFLFSLLVFLYFFKPNVKEFFGMTNRLLRRAVVTELLLCLVVIVAPTMAKLIMQ